MSLSLLGLLPQFNCRRHSWRSSSPTWRSIVICTVYIVTVHMGCTHENKDHSKRDLGSSSIHPWAPKLKIEVNCSWKSCVRVVAPFWPLDTVSYYVDVHVWYICTHVVCNVNMVWVAVSTYTHERREACNDLNFNPKNEIMLCLTSVSDNGAISLDYLRVWSYLLPHL